MFENTRENFDKLKKEYEEYVALYKIFNNGSVDGLCSFAEFYWRITYLHKYNDPNVIQALGN